MGREVEWKIQAGNTLVERSIGHRLAAPVTVGENMHALTIQRLKTLKQDHSLSRQGDGVFFVHLHPLRRYGPGGASKIELFPLSAGQFARPGQSQPEQNQCRCRLEMPAVVIQRPKQRADLGILERRLVN